MGLCYFFVKPYIFAALGIFALASTLGLSYAQVFQTPLDLSKDVPDSHEPQITVAGDTVYVIWTGFGSGVDDQDDVFFKKSSDGGATFSDTIDLSKNIGSSFNPGIAVSGNNVYVVWQDDTGSTGNTGIFFQKSSDGGATFGQAIHLSNNNGTSSNPLLFTDGRYVYSVWMSNETNKANVYSRSSSDDGSTFENAKNLSRGSLGVSNPAFTGNRSSISILWEEKSTAGSSIVLRKSDDGGATFSDTINLTKHSDNSSHPAISIYNNKSYVVWQDNIHGTNHIMFSRES